MGQIGTTRSHNKQIIASNLYDICDMFYFYLTTIFTSCSTYANVLLPSTNDRKYL